MKLFGDVYHCSKCESSLRTLPLIYVAPHLVVCSLLDCFVEPM